MEGLGANVQVVVTDDEPQIRVDEKTGTVERDTPDGGTVVQFNAVRKKDGEEGGFDENLAERLSDERLAEIAQQLFEAIEADDNSRRGYLEVVARAMDFLGLDMKEPRVTAGDASSAVEGQSQVTNPLLLEACLKAWAQAQAELLPAEGPVKVDKGMGEVSIVEDELADTLELDFNYYLTDTAGEYYPDTSHMLLWGTIFKGSGYKKVYRCARRRRPVSDSVDAKDLIVSDTVKDLRSCERITHKVEMRPSDLKRMVHLGAYRKTPLSGDPYPLPNVIDDKIREQQKTQKSTRPDDQPYTIWETQCELDIPEFTPTEFRNSGVRLPYLVTMEKDDRTILAIRRDWKEDDRQCERRRMYVKYPYVPGPGFYGTGMIGIVGNCSMAMTAAWREALDAGMYANFPSGTIAKLGGRQNTSDMRLAPGTFVPVETGGLPINQVVAPLPYRDVTAGLLQLMDKVTNQAKEVGGVADLPAGEGIQNVPVGTMLANIEQATKVIAASHKGMHQAQAEEIELLADLFREDPESFWRWNKRCKSNYWNEEKFIQALNTCGLRPRTDPNTPSHLHRIAKALGLVQFAAMPMFTPYFVLKELVMRVLRILREDPTGLIQDPPPMPMGMDAKPGPDPLVGQARMLAAQTQAQQAQTKAVEGQQQIQLGQAKLQAQRDISTAELAKEMVIHQRDAQKSELDSARQHRLEMSRLAHEQQADMAGLAHERGGAVHEQRMDVANLGLEHQKLAHERERLEHDKERDVAEHQLNVHSALHPPKKPSGDK